MLEVYRVQPPSEWYFYIFMVAFSLMATLKIVFAPVFNRDIHNILSLLKPVETNYRDVKKWRGYNSVVNILYSTLISFVFFLIIKDKDINIEFNLDNFTYIFTATISIIILKYIFDVVFSWIFNIFRLFKKYENLITAFRILLSFYMLPVIFVIYFSSFWANPVFSNIFLSIAFIAFIVHIMLIGIISVRSINSFLFFLLYICAVELAPLVIIYKLFQRIIALI